MGARATFYAVIFSSPMMGRPESGYTKKLLAPWTYSMDVSGIRILVIGDDTRSALAIVRSLWRAGAEVSLASERAESPVVRSRAVRKVYALPSSAASISAWSRRIKEIFLKNEFDAVLPATETAWLGLMRMRDFLPESALRFLPDEKAFEFVYRKSKTLELARSL